MVWLESAVVLTAWVGRLTDQPAYHHPAARGSFLCKTTGICGCHTFPVAAGRRGGGGIAARWSVFAAEKSRACKGLSNTLVKGTTLCSKVCGKPVNISDSFPCQFTFPSLFKTGFLISPLLKWSPVPLTSRWIYTHDPTCFLFPASNSFSEGEISSRLMRWSLSLNLEAVKLWTNSETDFPFLKSWVGGVHA